MKGVSVIIPCLNEEKYITSCLEGLIHNGFDNSILEILVIDGGSTDKTKELVSDFSKRYSFVKWLDNKKQKTPFALNLGVNASIYNHILIAGAHAVYPSGYISELYSLIHNKGIDVIGGVLETRAKNESAKTKAICFALSHPFGVGNSVFRIGAKDLLEVDTVPFGLYKKEIFEKVGLYNEKLIRNHDMELSSRIKSFGYRIWMDPQLRCTYFARETFYGLATNNYGNGFWNVKTLAITQKISSLGLRHFIPLIFLLSLVLPFLGALLIKPLIGLLALASLVSYLALLIFIYLKNKEQNFFYFIASFVVLHFSYGWGSFIGCFTLLKLKV